MCEEKFLDWNIQSLTKFVKALKNDDVSDVDIFEALIVYYTFSKGIDSEQCPEKELENKLIEIGVVDTNVEFFNKITIHYPLPPNKGKDDIKRNIDRSVRWYWVAPLSKEKLKNKYLIDKYLSFLNHKPVPQIKDDELLIKLDSSLNSQKGLTSKLIPELIKEVNFNYRYQNFNSCALICRRICEILVIESLEKYNNDKDDSDKIQIENENGYLGFGRLIGKFKECRFPTVNKAMKDCLDNVKKYGDIGAHHKFIQVKGKDINDYIKPDIEMTINTLLQIGRFFE